MLQCSELVFSGSNILSGPRSADTYGKSLAHLQVTINGTGQRNIYLNLFLVVLSCHLNVT